MSEKTYSIHDKWTDIDKLNNVDIKSVDGIIESVKINGEEAGGGGSSDFSTAILTVNGDVSNNSIPTLLIDPDYGVEGSYGSTNGISSPFTIILYKGRAYVDLPQGTTSGNIEWNDDIEMYVITGDCALTISQ